MLASYGSSSTPFPTRSDSIFDEKSIPLFRILVFPIFSIKIGLLWPPHGHRKLRLEISHPMVCYTSLHDFRVRFYVPFSVQLLRFILDRVPRSRNKNASAQTAETHPLASRPHNVLGGTDMRVGHAPNVQGDSYYRVCGMTLCRICILLHWHEQNG